MTTKTNPRFDEALEALHQFIHREGHPQVPNKHVELVDGKEIRLEIWVSKRRSDYKHGKLSTDRVAALEAVPGWTWHPPQASSRTMLYPGEATAFARAGRTPEEAIRSLFNNQNAHQALLSDKELLVARKDLDESSGVAPPSPPGPRASRDLASIRRNLTVTTGEIAFLAGKKAAAVTHWRKGKKSFPEPVTGGRSPYFNLDEVHDWLELHDKLANEAPPSWLWRKSVQALHQTATDEDRSRLRGYVAAMVVVLPDFLDDISGFVELSEPTGFDQWLEGTSQQFDDKLAEFLRKHLVGVGLESKPKGCSARAFRLALEGGYTEFGLLDEALDALAELSAPEATTSVPLAALITGLIGDLPNPPASVLDLACGEATVLVDLLNRHRLPGLRLKGVEKDPGSAAIARIRLQLHASLTEADWDIEIGDSLAGTTLTGDFDAVVLDPPTRDSEEWVALAKSHLADNDNSRAFVLLPGSALKANGPCTSSIKRNQLEAVVLLPNRLKRESRGLALCVITNGKSAGEKFLHIDLSDLKVKNLPYGTTTPTSSQAGDDFPISDVCAAIAHWRAARTINGELLPYRQRSIRTSEAAKKGVDEAANPPARPSQSPTSPPNVADARRSRSRSLQAAPGDPPRGTASAPPDHLQDAASAALAQYQSDLGDQGRVAASPPPPPPSDSITDLGDQGRVAASPPPEPDLIPDLDSITDFAAHISSVLGAVGEVPPQVTRVAPSPPLLAPISRLSRRTFLTAIGDLVDFSLARKAKVINAQVDFSTNADNEPVAEVSIADDGTEIDRNWLMEALRIGLSPLDDEAAVHGYPTLEFTTSAMTFCKRVKLVSTPGSGKPVIEVTMDFEQMFVRKLGLLDRVEALESVEFSDEFRKACETLSDLSGQTTDHGTLVICDEGRPLSTISGGRSFKSESRQRALVEDLRAFLGLLFSEYADDVVIAVNGDPLSSGQTTRVEPDPLA